MKQFNPLKTRSTRNFLFAGLIGILASSVCNAGGFPGLPGLRGCNCETGSYPMAGPPAFAGPPAVDPISPMVKNACACSTAASACCGGGGMLSISSLYGSSNLYSSSDLYGYSGGPSHGSPAPGSFLSGYEGLPNMDGGGIHHRYPYHSYRRPWAHPGTPSTNVTIVW